MRSFIVIADMHIRDERVLEFIKGEARQHGGRARLTHDAIAEKFGCHRNTVLAITNRLSIAGMIRVDRSAKRGGYIYEAE